MDSRDKPGHDALTSRRGVPTPCFETHPINRYRYKSRVGLSDKRLASLEAAKRQAAEKVAIAARETNYQSAVEGQAEAVAQFRAQYPEAVANIFRALVGAHMSENQVWRLGNNLPEGKKQPPAVFGFTADVDPAHVRVQLLARSGEILWQGDENSDIRSQEW